MQGLGFSSMPAWHDLLLFLGSNALFALPIFALAWTASRLRPLAPAFLLHGLWCLFFLRMVLPINLALPFSLSGLTKTQAPIALPAMDTGFSEWVAHQPAASVAVSAVNGFFGVSTLLGCLWLLGFIWFFGRFLNARRNFRRAIRQGFEEKSGAGSELIEAWRNTFNIKRPVRLVWVDRRFSPFTLGLFRPVIALPLSLKHQPSTVRNAVIGHETAHIYRLDDLWIWLENFIRCLYFFNPLMAPASRQLGHERERLCDAWAIAKNQSQAHAYGRALLVALQQRTEAPVPVAAWHHSMSSLHLRIRDIAQHRGLNGWKKTCLGLSLLCMAWLLLPISGMAQGRVVLEAEPKAKQHFRNPLPRARITSGFGIRYNPLVKERAHHRGMDLVLPLGSKVVATADGVVREAADNHPEHRNWGKYVWLDHGEGILSFYAHLQDIRVQPGQQLKQGQVVGTVGASGKVTGPHLHFEIWEAGEAKDPALWIRDWTTD